MQIIEICMVYDLILYRILHNSIWSICDDVNPKTISKPVKPISAVHSSVT